MRDRVQVSRFAECSLVWVGARTEADICNFRWVDVEPAHEVSDSKPVATLDWGLSRIPDDLVLHPISYVQAREAEHQLARLYQIDGILDEEFAASDLPAIAGCHVLLTTSDEFFLSCLRRPNAQYQAQRWSASFEEQIKADGPCDSSQVETLRRGISEELSPDLLPFVDRITTTGIGRENYEEDAGLRQIRSTFLAMHASLSIGVDEAKRILDVGRVGVDKSENTAWIGLSMPTPGDLARSSSPLDLVNMGYQNRCFDTEVEYLSNPWHATSVARLWSYLAMR